MLTASPSSALAASQGEGTAKTGIVLGCVSAFETALLIAGGLTRGWGSAFVGIAVALAGLVLLALSTVLEPSVVGRGRRCHLRRPPLAVGLMFGALVGSAFGLLGTIADAWQPARRCEDARTKYAATANGEDFAATPGALAGH